MTILQDHCLHWETVWIHFQPVDKWLLVFLRLCFIQSSESLNREFSQCPKSFLWPIFLVFFFCWYCEPKTDILTSFSHKSPTRGLIIVLLASSRFCLFSAGPCHDAWEACYLYLKKAKGNPTRPRCWGSMLILSYFSSVVMESEFVSEFKYHLRSWFLYRVKA